MKLKSIRLSATIADHDLKTKAKQADKFLKKKHQVRFNVQLKGRLISRPELAYEILDKIICTLEYCGTKTKYTFKGITVSCVCNPKK